MGKRKKNSIGLQSVFSFKHKPLGPIMRGHYFLPQNFFKMSLKIPGLLRALISCGVITLSFRSSSMARLVLQYRSNVSVGLSKLRISAGSIIVPKFFTFAKISSIAWSIFGLFSGE